MTPCLRVFVSVYPTVLFIYIVVIVVISVHMMSHVMRRTELLDSGASFSHPVLGNSQDNPEVVWVLKTLK